MQKTATWGEKSSLSTCSAPVSRQTETAEPFSPCDGGREEGWNEGKKKQADATHPGLLLLLLQPQSGQSSDPAPPYPVSAGWLSSVLPAGTWYPGLHFCPPSSHTSPQPPPCIREVFSPLPCSALPHHTHTHTHTHSHTNTHTHTHSLTHTHSHTHTYTHTHTHTHTHTPLCFYVGLFANLILYFPTDFAHPPIPDSLKPHVLLSHDAVV